MSDHEGRSAPTPAPPTAPARTPRPAETPDATGGLIPYKNPRALIGYYTAIASLVGLVVPILGIVVSIAAIVLGVGGRRFAKAHPTASGSAHAWTAIVIGSFMTLYHLAWLVFVLFTMMGR